MSTSQDAMLRELDGLRSLARALVAGDADADDLLQDAALTALEHPPDTDRPVRPWLAAVLRNRRRMDRRAAVRRQQRDLAAVPDETIASDRDPIDRARALERLSAALVALDEPFRTTVIRRYLDDESAADIARSLDIPAGTVRWRLKTGLDRLRAALDEAGDLRPGFSAAEGRCGSIETIPRWRNALIPFVPTFAKGALLVKVKTSLVFAVLLLVLVGGGVWLATRDRSPHATTPNTPPVAALPSHRASPLVNDAGAPVVDPLPGQGRVRVATDAVPGGSLAGRVINWSSGEGVAGAEITFTGDTGAITVRSRTDGGFELAPAAPGAFTLTAAAAPGFLPYAPEFFHSPVHVALAKDHAVRGLTVFMFPALDYHGRVIDAAGAPVVGARVKLLGTPTGEQTIDHLATDWTSAADGTFVFHAADDAVLEAVRGTQRGWAILDGNVAITKQLVIKLGDAPPRDATIIGKVVDPAGRPVADVLITAAPDRDGRLPPSSVPTSAAPIATTGARATSFATTGPDGGFVLEHLDRDSYQVSGEVEDQAPVTRTVNGGATDVTLTIEPGVLVSGTVATATEDPVPSFTLTVFRRDGASRELEIARSIVEPGGRFDVHLRPGDVELIATASGLAPSEPVHVTAKVAVTDVKLVVSAGGTLRGAVIDASSAAPIPFARVMREARGGGASALPANAGTVTRADGTFELTGIPAGPVSITIGADSYHPRIEGGMTVRDGETLGPISLRLTPLADGEQPTLELVGIGVKLTPDGDALRVDLVIPNSGAAAAGVVVGDHVVAVDGVATAELGVNGAVAKIRGAEGTTVAITLKRGAAVTTLAIERRKLKA